MLKKTGIICLLTCILCSYGTVEEIQLTSAASRNDYQATPPFMTAGVPPLVMLVMGRNHKLYYEAYNDASDLNQDGQLDVGYNPAIDYYGYFDSFKAYTYDSADGRFEPTSQLTKPNKTVSGANEWSGDFLNYLTMSRMDCLRKVLYGGYRSTDTFTETVLKRAYIPQDAHSWGKEYKDVATDGYDISDYTPFSLPTTGTRHLFATTALSDNGDPILRVMPNNSSRIWQWVAKERPVCDTSLESAGGVYGSHPNNHSDYDDMVAQFANASHFLGDYSNDPVDPEFNDRIDVNNDTLGDNNPFDSPDNNDNYMTIFTGTMNIPSDDTYTFAVDGDDAVEIIIDGVTVAGWYGGHGNCGCTTYQGDIYLTAGSHTFEFRHEEAGGGDSYFLYWNQGAATNVWEVVPPGIYTTLTQSFYDLNVPSSTITDYKVYVQVAVDSGGIDPEDNCKLYPDGNYKPIGLLQRHGESGRMLFGLLSGSYTNNTSGGVLRKNVGSITDEINANTGEFLYIDGSTVDGIIESIDKFRVIGFNYGDHSYNVNCGWVTSRPINEGECRMWGNPVGEMMYETLRYFSGAGTAYTDFDYNASDGTLDDNVLGLPKTSWDDPYDASTGYEYCAKPFMLVISDIYPTYDSDQLPGSYFSGQATEVIGNPANPALDVATLADAISTTEAEAGNHFVGQEAATFDNACTAKSVSGFGDIRGLCPEEPTKQGSYYSGSVAYYGRTSDIHATATDDQNVSTFAVGLASPLPKINIPVAGNTITLVPFAKSVGGCYGPYGTFQPTNTIVDFFVQEITDTYGKFRINYEDVEQGADHDMDAIVEYEYQVVDGVGNPVSDPALGVSVEITLTSTYASGCIIQHMGYIISGTNADGIYLEVRDVDTGAGSDVDYVLDTPNIAGALPTVASRSFTPGVTGGATLLKDPLWYAAKWGAFTEDTTTANNIPDQTSEWDENSDGTPDTYYYVQNPLYLERQLNKSFADILRRVSSGSAASVISQSRSGEGAIYQAVFYPQMTGPFGNNISWAGDVHSLLVDEYGNMREDTNGNHALDVIDEDTNGNGTLDAGEDKNNNGTLDGRDLIIMYDGTDVYKYDDANENSQVDSEDWTEFIPPIPAWYDNGVLDTEDANGNGILEPAEDLNSNNKLDKEDTNNNGIMDTELVPGIYTMQEIEYLWSANDWLNHLTDTQAKTQRGAYASTADNRFIYTFIDENENMEVDSGEMVPFTCTSPPAVADLTDTSKIFPYLTVFPTFSDEPAEIVTARISTPSVFEAFLQGQTQRLINYVRGEDQPSATFGSYSAPAFRSRKIDYDNDGTVETWRLGDVIYSTPTVVGRPSENLHLLYGDLTYAAFAQKYMNRRQMVYVGGNDGMFHAFNAGFFDNYNDVFKTAISMETQFDLGAEMWAFVPYNLLPHLFWLTEPDYPHVYYCDLKPKVFDARIFTPDADHPYGWGTVMVAGMRLGGGNIQADMDKTDGSAVVPGTDRTMTSAYFIFDITNPEVPPTLLAEISFPGMGFTTCHPAAFSMNDKDPATKTINENEFYLIFGSGPAKSDGTASHNNDLTFAALSETASKQTGKIYIVDLVELGTNGNLRTLQPTGSYATSAPYYFEELDANSFISGPVSIDFDLNYSSDVIYFGTVSGDETSGWGGKMRRVAIENDLDFSNWIGDSTLIDLSNVENGQPITATANVAVDPNGDRWVYFGTGRFMVEADRSNDDQQSYYGIKEPVDTSSGSPVWTWAEVSRGEKLSTDTDGDGCYEFLDGDIYIDGDSDLTWDTPLLNVTNSEVYIDKTVSNTCDSSITNWNQLATAMDTYQGWYRNFTDPKERNLGEATLFADLLLFTTYAPSIDACAIEGSSWLYGLYYRTGTAYYKNVFDKNISIVTDRISLGPGLAETPNIHVGRGGTEAMVQTSTGAIQRIEQTTPGNPKSHAVYWEQGCN